MIALLMLPLDLIKPEVVLARYHHWIYFTILLTFFISISGVALRKHFDKPYVKPLIISVGSLMTVAIYLFREYLAVVIEGWGILGSLLLAFMAALIPYCLCRGFGISKSKAAYFTVVLVYLIVCVRFKFLFQTLSSHNLGIVNLALFVLFTYSAWKLIPFRGSTKLLASKIGKANSHDSQEIEKETRQEAGIEAAVNKYVVKLNKKEIKTIAHMRNALEDIIQTIKSHNSGLTNEDRQAISNDLLELLRFEYIYKNQFSKFDKMFRVITVKEQEELYNLKQRMQKASSAQKKIIKQEISIEQEKHNLRNSINNLKGALVFNWRKFDALIRSAAVNISKNQNPVPAGRLLYKAYKELGVIASSLKALRGLGQRLAHLVRLEKSVLSKENQSSNH